MFCSSSLFVRRLFCLCFKLRLTVAGMSGAFCPADRLTESPQISTLSTWRTKSTTLNKLQKKNSGKGRSGEFRKGKTGRISKHAKEKKKRSTLQSQAKSHKQEKKDFHGRPTPDTAPNNYQLA